jgi:agmatine/peptidylarginine deiminase
MWQKELQFVMYADKLSQEITTWAFNAWGKHAATPQSTMSAEKPRQLNELHNSHWSIACILQGFLKRVKGLVAVLPLSG